MWKGEEDEKGRGEEGGGNITIQRRAGRKKQGRKEGNTEEKADENGEG